ncbi:MAG TPA: hypothetical protein VFI68_02990 [Anaerolineales bacterium]|nr:hypothetical protein [Anaerolineales bacterium]
MHWTPPAPSEHPPQSTTSKSGWGFTVHKSYLEREAGFEFFLLPGRVHERPAPQPAGQVRDPAREEPLGDASQTQTVGQFLLHHGNKSILIYSKEAKK